MRKKFSFWALAVMVFVIVIMLAHNILTRDSVVLRVGDIDVTETEFLLVFHNEFRAEYVSSSDDDEKRNVLNKAYKKVLEYKAEQMLFEKYDVCEWSYDSFKIMYEEQSENEETKSMYGTQNFTEYDYYVYQQSNYRNETLRKIQEVYEDEGAIYHYYQENADEFRDMDQFIFDHYSISKTSEGGKELLSLAASGTEVKEVTYRNIILNPKTAKYEQGLLVDMEGHTEEMKQVGTQVFLENETEWILVKTVEYTQGEVRAFDDCYSQVYNQFFDEYYETLIEEMLENTKIEKTKAYENIPIS